MKGEFKPECPLPPEGTRFVYAPSVRSTLDILWSCISVLVLCTFSILHLTVPIQAAPSSNGQCWRRWASRTWRKFKWMIIALFAPEVILAFAVVHLASSLYNKRAMADLADTDKVQWTTAHSFFANMGGIAIKFGDNLPSPECSPGVDPEDQHTLHSPSETEIESPQLQGIGPQLQETSYPQREVGGNTNMATPVPNLESGESSGTYLDKEQDISVEAPTPDLEAGKGHNACLEKQLSAGTSTRPTMRSSPTTPSPESASTVNVRNWVSTRSQDAKWGLDAFEQVTLRVYSSLGDGPWQPCRRNRAAVEAALRIVKHEDLTTGPNKNPLAWYTAIAALQSSVWILTASQLQFARESGIISSLPNIRADDLDNQSNSDALVKGLALLQTSWLVLQLIARRIHQYETSQLEILTLALNIFAFVTYIVLWKKPQDITTATVVDAQRHPRPDEVVALGGLGPLYLGPSSHTCYLPNNCYPRMIVNRKEVGGDYLIIVSLVGGIMFGGLHCLAWNFVFPTEVEGLLWRISSILTLGSPVLSAGIVIVQAIFFKHNKKVYVGTKGLTMGQTMFYSVVVPGIIYVLARLFIIVEAFRTLGFLPPEAYHSTWVENAP